MSMHCKMTHKNLREKAKAKAKETLTWEKDSTKECKMNLHNLQQALHANIAKKEDTMTPNVGSNTQN